MFKIINHRHARQQPSSPERKNIAQRLGAVAVEFAVVAPVFGLFCIAMVEFGHVYMSKNVIRAAARKAARLGVSDSVTTAQVKAEAQRVLASAFKNVSIEVDVKNASLFDEAEVEADNIDYANLPDVELSNAEPMELFIVRISIPYEDVAILPTFWANDLTLTAQCVMRHE
jgi:hypothetical protein